MYVYYRLIMIRVNTSFNGGHEYYRFYNNWNRNDGTLTLLIAASSRLDAPPRRPTIRASDRRGKRYDLNGPTNLSI